MGNLRTSSVRRGRILSGLVVASVVFGACGHAAPAPKTTTTTASPTTTTVKTATACTTALMAFTPVFGGSAAGGSYFRFEVKNIGPKVCSLHGYPALDFFAPNAAGGAGSGVPVTLSVTDFGAAPSTVTLNPTQSAQFLLVYTEVPVNGAGCASVASVNIKLPDQAGSTPVPVSFAPCGGVVKVYAFAAPGSQNP